MITLIVRGSEAMAWHRQDWFEGWRLFGVLTLTLIGFCLWIAPMRQFQVEGIRIGIPFTPRPSLIFFCGMRRPDMPLYTLFLIPLLAVFILRMVAMAPRAERAVPAG